jgi:DNA-directed RNA polymerase subunit RPC12/RpoP
MRRKQPKQKISLGVYRCGRCGDTFPASADEVITCPTCGSEVVEPATEPFL